MIWREEVAKWRCYPGAEPGKRDWQAQAWASSSLEGEVEREERELWLSHNSF